MNCAKCGKKIGFAGGGWRLEGKEICIACHDELAEEAKHDDRIRFIFGEGGWRYEDEERKNEFLKQVEEREKGEVPGISESTVAHTESRVEETTTQAQATEGTHQQQPIPMKANPRIAGTRCPSCQLPISLGQDVMKCGSCETIYHAECWEKAGGCTNSTCPANPARAVEAEETKLCPWCRQRVKKTAIKCRYCGEYVDLQERERQRQPKGTLKQASEALTYALVGLVCFGIILEPIALVKGIRALNTIKADPTYKGRGKAIAAIIISIIILFLWVIGIIARIAEIASY